MDLFSAKADYYVAVGAYCRHEHWPSVDEADKNRIDTPQKCATAAESLSKEKKENNCCFFQKPLFLKFLSHFSFVPLFKKKAKFTNEKKKLLK